jgi:rubrerythrin
MTELRDRFKLTAEERSTLDMCIMIEEKCAALYRHFEHLDGNTPDLAALWRAIASEEESHAETFRRADRLKGVGLEFVKSCDSSLGLIQKINGIIDSSLETSPSRAEALACAITLEIEVQEYYLETTLKFDDTALEQAFMNNLFHTKEHVNLLQSALDGISN